MPFLLFLLLTLLLWTGAKRTLDNVGLIIWRILVVSWGAPYIPFFCCCFASWRVFLLCFTHTHTHTLSLSLSLTHTHTHGKPATTHSSRKVNWYCCGGVDVKKLTGFSSTHVASCTLTACFFCIAYSRELVSENLLFLIFFPCTTACVWVCVLVFAAACACCLQIFF